MEWKIHWDNIKSALSLTIREPIFFSFLSEYFFLIACLYLWFHRHYREGCITVIFSSFSCTLAFLFMISFHFRAVWWSILIFLPCMFRIGVPWWWWLFCGFGSMRTGPCSRFIRGFSLSPALRGCSRRSCRCKWGDSIIGLFAGVEVVEVFYTVEFVRPTGSV